MIEPPGIETVRVPLGARAYDIRIGPGLVARAGAEIAPLLPRPRVAVLTEERVAALGAPPDLAAVRRNQVASSRRAEISRPARSSRVPAGGDRCDPIGTRVPA